MFDEEDRPKKKEGAGLNRNLETLSVEDLKSYRQELTDEIARVDAEIAKKSDYFSQADQFFKS